MAVYFGGILYQSDLKGWALLCYGMYKGAESEAGMLLGDFLRS